MASGKNPTNGNSSDNGHAGDYGGYFRVQDRLFDWYGRLLGPIAIAVYNYLARCADQNGCCFPSYEDIALKVGISRRAAIRAITKLGRYGLIEIQHCKNRREKRGNYTSNRYKIRLEAFTDKGAHREVVSISHQVVTISHQVVSEVHSKDYPLKDNPNKGRGIVEGGLTTASTNPPNHPQKEAEENTPHTQEQELNLTSLATTHSSVDDPPSARVNKTETPKGSQPAWAEQKEEGVLNTATQIQPPGHEKPITAEAIQVYREAHANRIGTPPTIHKKDRPILARLIETRAAQAYDGDIDQGNKEICLNLAHYLKCEGKCEKTGFSLEFFSAWYDIINAARIRGEVIDGYDHTWSEIKNMRSNRKYAKLMAEHAAGDGRTFDQDGNPTNSPRSSFEAGYSHTTVAQEFVGGFREKFHRDITQEERERVMAIADRLGANPARDVIQHALSLTKGNDSEQFINTLCDDLIRMVA